MIEEVCFSSSQFEMKIVGERILLREAVRDDMVNRVRWFNDPAVNKTLLIEEKLVAFVLCLMVLMVAAQVISRYVLHTSLSHTEELVRYFFVWITFLGASAAVFKGKHLSVAGALHIIPDHVIKYIKIFSGFAALIFTGLLVVFGTNIVLLQIRTGQTTAAMGFPMWIIGLAVPVCSLVIVIRLIMIASGKRGQL